MEGKLQTPQRPPERQLSILDELIAAKQEHRKFTWEESEREHQKVEDTEQNFAKQTEYEKTLGRILERYGCNVEITKVAPDLFKIKVPRDAVVTDLPRTHALKGGAARAALLQALDIDPDASPRDIDLVRVVKEDLPGLDAELAAELSPEDLKHNHGVEALKENYFQTRDFTINEVLVHDGSIYLTKACLLDTLRGIIRFSEFEKKQPSSESRASYAVQSKLIAKAVRMVAETWMSKREVILADSEIFQFQELDTFSMVLHLDRAFERGYEVAEEYVRQLRELKKIPEDIETPEKAVDYFLTRMRETFVLRCASRYILTKEEKAAELFDAEFETWENLPKRTPHSRDR
jgi:hypothetical protein